MLVDLVPRRKTAREVVRRAGLLVRSSLKQAQLAWTVFYNRCRYCLRIREVRRRHGDVFGLPPAKRRKKPRKLDVMEKNHLHEILRRYGEKIPSRLIAGLFDVSPTTITLELHAIGLELSVGKRRRLTENWVRKARCPRYAYLSEDEQARLSELWRKMKKDYRAGWSERSDRATLASMEREQLRLMTNGADYAESACRNCNKVWPRTPHFFKASQRWRRERRQAKGLNRNGTQCDYLAHVCRFCRNRSQRKQARQKKLRERTR